MMKLFFLMCLAALVALAIPAMEPVADAGLMPLHQHGTTEHRHRTEQGTVRAALIEQYGHDPRLLHVDPNRPDESHNYDIQPKDGTTTIRYDDGSGEVMHVMGDMATYDGRQLIWDPHGGGHWVDPEDPYFVLVMWPPMPPEFPVARALEFDMSKPAGERLVRQGTW